MAKKSSAKRKVRRSIAPPAVITPFPVEQAILSVRGQRVIIDADLAALYQVETRALNQAVKRNAERFPEDFMSRLSPEETDALRSQIVISNVGRGGRRYAPFAFTEHGAIMAASVLNSERAVEVSVFVVRAFVRMRRMLAENRELGERLSELERRVGDHHEALRRVVAAIDGLMDPPEPEPKGRIGFRPKGGG